MRSSIYKWLPRIFGCHCRPDRSFYYKGKQFPLCARCTGELAGILIGGFVFWFYKPQVFVLIIMMLPMVTDGFVQLKTAYVSNNVRRLWTGMLFGYALVTLLFMSTAYVYELGHEIGINIAGSGINV